MGTLRLMQQDTSRDDSIKLRRAVDVVGTRISGVSMDAHTGLRGILALHVALFHFVLFSDLKIPSCGNVQMPFFFLLSGFSLAVIYGDQEFDFKTNWKALKRFYRNRLARCLPLFYLCNAVGIPLAYFGHGPHKTEYVQALANSVFATSTWLHGEGPDFNGPGWTVSTLMAFYWLFPLLNTLTKRAATTPTITPCVRLALGVFICTGLYYGAFFLLMARSDTSANSYAALAVGILGGGAAMSVGPVPTVAGGGWLDRLWWLQLALGAVLFRGVYWVGEGYWACTGWPVSRLPVFLMGCLGGHLVRNSKGTLLVWAGRVRETPEWARYVDRAGVLYCAVLIVASVMDNMAETFEAYHVYPRCSILLQLLCPALQLTIIVGLTQEGGQSIFGRLCCSRIMGFAGRISMALYLVHMPVQSCFMIMLRGAFPEVGDGTKEYCRTYPVTWECHTRYEKYFFLPTWGILVVTIVSLIVAWFVERYVEAPMRNFLRANPRTSNDELSAHGRTAQEQHSAVRLTAKAA